MSKHYPHHSPNYHESFNAEHSFNTFQAGNHQSYDEDSALTHTEQHGLLNLNLSPAINVPVHDNNILNDIDLF